MQAQPRLIVPEAVTLSVGAVVIGALISVVSMLLSPWLVVGVLLLLGAALLLLRHPIIMCHLVIYGIIFGSSMARGELIPLLVPNEVLLLVSVVLVIVFAIVFRIQRHIPITPLLAVGILTVGTALLPAFTYPLRSRPLAVNELLPLLAPIQYILLCAVFIFIPRDKRQVFSLVQTMLFACTIVAIIGLLQAARVPLVVSLLETWYPTGQTLAAEGVNRVTSTLGSWNTLGTFLMTNLLLVAALYRYQPEQPNPWYRWNTRIMVLTALACLLASGSWASIFGLVLGVSIIARANNIQLRRFAVVLVLIPIAILAVLPLISARLEFQFASGDGSVVPQTLQYRFYVWTEIYIPLIAENPWWGITPTLTDVRFQFAESQYLLLLFRSGVFSLLAHLVWAGMMMGWLRRTIRTGDPLSRAFALLIYVMFINLLLMSLTNPVFTYSGTMDYLWILTGLIICLRGRETLSVANTEAAPMQSIRAAS